MRWLCKQHNIKYTSRLVCWSFSANGRIGYCNGLVRLLLLVAKPIGQQKLVRLWKMLTFLKLWCILETR